jgi:hypothetical protein
MAKEEKRPLTFWDAMTKAKLEYLRTATGRQEKTPHTIDDSESTNPKPAR